MQAIGTLPGKKISNVIRGSRRESVFSSLYGIVNLQSLREIALEKFKVVFPTEENYYKTVSSWDQTRVWLYE